jgi:hypothetical protein
MLKVNQLLAAIMSANKCLQIVKTEDIASKCLLLHSESDSHDKEIIIIITTLTGAP